MDFSFPEDNPKVLKKGIIYRSKNTNSEVEYYEQLTTGHKCEKLEGKSIVDNVREKNNYDIICDLIENVKRKSREAQRRAIKIKRYDIAKIIEEEEGDIAKIINLFYEESKKLLQEAINR